MSAWDAPIDAMIVANKLLAARQKNHPDVWAEMQAEPRYAELLWFIQWQSMQPGGLREFANEIVEEFVSHIGTPTMLLHPDATQYPPGVAAKVWAEIEGRATGYLGSLRFQSMTEADAVDAAWSGRDGQTRSPEAARRACREIACVELPRLIAEYCTNAAKRFTTNQAWFVSDLTEVLLRKMETWECAIDRKTADTAIKREIFDALEFATSETAFVLVEGHSRRGKTEALECWCKKRPGQARCIAVPPSNSDASFFREIAGALGIYFAPSTCLQVIKERVEFVIAQARFCIVLDEAHYIIPQQYSKTTAPSRLNWIRAYILDKHLPCVVAVTPQSYEKGLGKYLTRTGFAIEQWVERIDFHVALPKEVESAELLSVAKLHFPEFTEGALKFIAGEVLEEGTGLHGITSIAKRARYLRKKEDLSEDAAVARAIREIKTKRVELTTEDRTTTRRGVPETGRALLQPEPEII
jgi:hypothetical protein